MPGRTAWSQTAGHVASFVLTTAVIVGVGFGSSALVAAAAEFDAQDAEFLASVNKIIAESGARPDASTSQACDRIVAAAINMDAVTQSAMSQRWDRMSPQQRSALRAAARRWTVRDCVRQNRGNEGNPLEFLGIKHVENGERLLATRSSKPAHTIIWRLRGGGKTRAVDVVVDGRSAILSIRSETRTLLDRSNDDIDVATEMLGR